MDWTKAKTILIVALLITNIVLVAFLTDSLRSDRDEKEILQYTISYLQDRGITISAEIPEKRQRMAYLSVRYKSTDSKEVERVIRSQTKSISSKASEKELWDLADSALRDLNLMSKTVGRGSIQPIDRGWKVSYQNVIDSIPIEKSYILLTIEDGKISNIEWDWLEPTEFSPSKKKITSPAQALMDFKFALHDELANSIPEGVEITEEAVEKGEGLHVNVSELQVVYWLNPAGISTDETLLGDTVSPFWKITYQVDGGMDQVKYIDALGI